MERPRSPGTYLRAQNNLLVKAAQIGHISQAKRALNRGANVNTYIDLKYEDTPLHTAVRNEHVPMVRLLLQAGADPNVPDKDMLTPLYWAANRGNISIARLLCQSGADLNAVDKYNRTLLHNAALFGQTKFVKLLLEEYGVGYAAAKDKWGDTALHKACQRGHEEVVQYLILNGAINPMSINNRGNTPMNEIHPSKTALAAMFRNIAFVRMQPMDIDIEQVDGDDVKLEDETSDEEDEGNTMREESEDVEMEDFAIEDTDQSSTTTGCCKTCTLL